MTDVPAPPQRRPADPDSEGRGALPAHSASAHRTERKHEKPVKVDDERVGINGKVALIITAVVGTMWCAYIFTLLALDQPAVARSTAVTVDHHRRPGSRRPSSSWSCCRSSSSGRTSRARRPTSGRSRRTRTPRRSSANACSCSRISRRRTPCSTTSSPMSSAITRNCNGCRRSSDPAPGRRHGTGHGVADPSPASIVRLEGVTDI